MEENAVTRWFGPRFGLLHPLLQELHRNGGKLRGIASVEAGAGLAGWVGRYLARRLGIPAGAPESALEVDIRHHEGALYWSRRFGNADVMLSVFTPVGAWPSGYWVERTGFLHLKLTVDIIEGGWYWRALQVRAGGWPLPLWLMPGSVAYKRIEDGRYFFCVGFSLPLLGSVLRYSGALEAESA